MEENKAGIGQRAIWNHSLLLRFPSAFSPSLNLFLMGNLHQLWEGKVPFHLVFSLRPISHAYPRKCRPWPKKSEVQTSLRGRGGGDHWGERPCSAPLGFTPCGVQSPVVPLRMPFPHSVALRELAMSFLRAGHEGTCFLLSNQTLKSTTSPIGGFSTALPAKRQSKDL